MMSSARIMAIGLLRVYSAVMVAFDCILVLQDHHGVVFANAVAVTRVHLKNNVGIFNGFRQRAIAGATGENFGDVISFLGIPYAEPPIGELRFKPPKPLRRWPERDAFKPPNSCWQMRDTTYTNHSGVDQWNANTEMSEDCLYLNVWVPADYIPRLHANMTSIPQRKLAVLVWIYGGSFNTGTSTLDIYDGRFLAARNKLIVVSLQYRLGPLGFLYLGIDEAPGNAGLWDQQVALSWVKMHIECFGGDPNRITIFGESAGAVSVGFQLLSPFSESLFRRAIMQSGSALAPWGTIDKLEAIDRGIRLAESVYCPYKLDRRDLLVKCLQNVAAKSLVDKQFLVFGNPFFESPFAPVVEGGFLQNQPSLMLRQFQNGDRLQKELLMGINKNEAMYFLVYALQEPPDTADRNTVSFFGSIPRDPPIFTKKQFLSTLRRISDDPHNILIDSVAFEYMNHPTKPTDTYLEILDDLFSDYLFKCPTITFADFMSEHNPLYFYSFEHQTTNLYDLYNWPEWMGVIHGYEIDYIFGVPFNNSLYTEQERRLSGRMMDFWTRFAKTGNPNTDDEKFQSGSQTWPKYQASKRHVVLETLGQNQPISVRNGSVRHPKCEFWNQLINKWSVELKAMKESAARGCKCPGASGSGAGAGKGPAAVAEMLTSGSSNILPWPSFLLYLLVQTLMTR